MKRLLLAVILALVIGGVAAAAGAVPEKPRRCAPQQARVIAKSQRVQVYRLRGRTHACHTRTSRRHPLADHSSGAAPTVFWLTAIRLAGDFVGAGIVISRGEDQPGVIVRNVRTGALVHSAEAVTSLGRKDDKLRAYVRDLVLHPSGDVAWIAQNANVWPVRFEVYKIDTAGRRVLVDASSSIDPESLALSGRVVHWIDGEKRRLSRLKR